MRNEKEETMIAIDMEEMVLPVVAGSGDDGGDGG